MTYNVRVKTFVVSGVGTFTCAPANGVYVERGDAGGPGYLNRMVGTGTGAIHDMDGTADGVRVPPKLWQELVFQASHPAAHTQYDTLVSMVGKHGTLTVTRPTASGEETKTATARLLPIKGEWKAPFRTGVQNTFTVRVEWQLKALLA